MSEPRDAAAPPPREPGPAAEGHAHGGERHAHEGEQQHADEHPAQDGAEQSARDPFEEAGRSPLGGEGSTGGTRAARAARKNLFLRGSPERVHNIRGDSQYYEGNVFLSQQFTGSGPVVLDGPVPAEELERLRDVYLEAPGYARMKAVLRARRLLVLCGEPGSGRTATALSLLSELAPEGVVRLDPQTTDLRAVTGDALRHGHGHVLELPREEGGDGGRELHLDRFSALLAEAGAYGVVVADHDDPSERLLRGRYGMYCTPPSSEEVLHRHLRVLLKDAGPGALDTARAHARGEQVTDALGLEELRPGEAARLAVHLADRQRGKLSDGQLLDACAGFVPAQAREWFAGADAPGAAPEALPGLSAAAFRVAVAVFNGSSYGLTTEAGEQLAWEFSLTLDPERAPGRRLFGTHAEHRPSAARSVLYDGELDLGTEQVPVRAVRFRGEGLATAVLHEVWHGYHNARGPVSRWLRALCDDPRPLVWVRASLAAGALCAWDWVHGCEELVGPMAGTDSPVSRMAAATALAQASREPSVRPAVQGLLGEWAETRTGIAGNLRATAVLTHGYGMAAGSVPASLDALGRLARGGGREVLPEVSHSVLRLLAGTGPDQVVGRLGCWLRDGRAEYRDLVLLTVVSALRTRATFLWGLEDVPELEEYGTWPCAAALLRARPERAGRLADLVRHALGTARSGAAALDAMGSWMRQAAGDEAQLAALCGFLPHLVGDRREADRLRHLLARLVRDVDEPLDKEAARRMWDALQADEQEEAQEETHEEVGR
ncbi:ATP-binding protein [Streptomyces sp. ODS28]|uniref:ATP-binding protein n=1 Tax=Streptomyces sp. ODS28 TaxID=3136688 RepID=UPI0031E907C0